ncbi:hypothetical protein [Salipiger thiooxidans]|uniref:hypothetical protein n=1 Tax=Salipiger thiooxidans TaxID=282683 RepID=UPI001042501F|nr:hypothetical protein [Salipiger thiooxidans]
MGGMQTFSATASSTLPDHGSGHSVKIMPPRAARSATGAEERNSPRGAKQNYEIQSAVVSASALLNFMAARSDHNRRDPGAGFSPEGMQLVDFYLKLMISVLQEASIKLFSLTW